MRTFSIFIMDERYAVPTVALINVDDLLRAAEVAQARLEESPHHQSVELFEDDRPLALFDREGIIWHEAVTKGPRCEAPS
jgi:hypothetical protein